MYIYDGVSFSSKVFSYFLRCFGFLMLKKNVWRITLELNQATIYLFLNIFKVVHVHRSLAGRFDAGRSSDTAPQDHLSPTTTWFDRYWSIHPGDVDWCRCRFSGNTTPSLLQWNPPSESRRKIYSGNCLIGWTLYSIRPRV